MVIQGTRATPRFDIGGALQEYTGPEGLIGGRVFPVFRSMEQTANFDKVSREGLARIPETRRGASGKYNRVEWATETDSFNCIEHGLENALSDRDRRKYRSSFAAELVAAKVPMNSLLLAQEKRVADAVFNTTTWTGASLYTDNSGTPWTTASTDTRTQVHAALAKVEDLTGITPNSLIINRITARRLQANDDIQESIKYVKSATAAALEAALADFYGLDNVLIANARYNGADENQTFSGSKIWSNLYASVCYIHPDPEDFSQPTLGRTFLWDEDSPENPVVESYRDEPIRSDVFRVRHDTDEKVLEPYLAHLMKIAAS